VWTKLVGTVGLLTLLRLVGTEGLLTEEDTETPVETAPVSVSQGVDKLETGETTLLKLVGTEGLLTELKLVGTEGLLTLEEGTVPYPAGVETLVGFTGLETELVGTVP